MQIPCVYFNALIQVSDSEEECVNLSNGNVIGLIDCTTGIIEGEWRKKEK